MKKKYLSITLHDGREIRRDITLEKIAPIGAPANAPEYLQYLLFVLSAGITDVDLTNENMLTLITPSSMKKVQIVFE